VVVHGDMLIEGRSSWGQNVISPYSLVNEVKFPL